MEMRGSDKNPQAVVKLNRQLFRYDSILSFPCSHKTRWHRLWVNFCGEVSIEKWSRERGHTALYKQGWLSSVRLISERQRWAKYSLEFRLQDEVRDL
jgi:hypothetical protein